MHNWIIPLLIGLVVGIFLGGFNAAVHRWFAEATMRAATFSGSDLLRSTSFDSTLPLGATIPHGLRSYDAANAKVKKHPQFILAIEAAFFDACAHFMEDLNYLYHGDFLAWAETMSHLVIKERGSLEPDGDYRQLLPYTIVRRLEADGQFRFLTYQRTSKVGEQRLAGKVSIGFGGHVDFASAVAGYGDVGASTIDLAQTLILSAERERDEELRVKGEANEFRSACKIQDLPIAWGDCFITQESTPERMHVGIVMYIELPPGIELECAEPELTTLGMKTAEELLVADEAHEIELEAWSRLLLTEYLKA